MTADARTSAIQRYRDMSGVLNSRAMKPRCSHLLAAFSALAVCVATACADPKPSPPSADSDLQPPQPTTKPLATPEKSAWERLDPARRELLRTTSARVLLPPQPTYLAAAFLTADTDWYTASIDGNGITIVIEGRSRSIDHPEIRAAFPPTPASRAKPRVGRNELIVESAFLEQDTSYSVEVECAMPATDPRCTEDAFVRGLTTSLIAVTPPPTSTSAKKPPATVTP